MHNVFNASIAYNAVYVNNAVYALDAICALLHIYIFYDTLLSNEIKINSDRRSPSELQNRKICAHTY